MSRSEQPDSKWFPSNGPLALLAALVLGAALLGAAALAEAAAPIVSIEAATPAFTTAKVEGKVNPEDHETSYHFEYVTQAQFEASGWSEAGGAGFGSVGEGAGATTVEATLEGLVPGTTYHLRLLAENSEGERAEAVAPTFATEPVTRPSVTIDPIAGSPVTSASFSGTVDADAPAGPLSEATQAAYRTEWHFECEPGCGGPLAGEIAGEAALEPADNPHVVEGQATNLQPHTTYRVKLVAANAGGSAEAGESGGQPVEFTTPATKLPQAA